MNIPGQEDQEILVAKMRFGSQVYGTSTPSSDEDFKVIFIPTARDILLQRATKTSRSHSTGDEHAKNAAGDVDIEEFSLSGYMKLLCDGQTVAVDMLFVPEEHILESSVTWNEIRRARETFLSRSIAPFVGYCRSQANKYGIKGSRMAAAKAAVEALKNLDQGARVGDYNDELALLAVENEHIDLVPRFSKKNETHLWHLSVCGKLAPFTLRISRAVEMYEGLWYRYGERARQAMNNEGIDWKALMHAKRICDQAVELLATGHITFPRPNAEDLLKIRLGELPYTEVAEQIEMGMATLEVAMRESTLQAKPDRGFADFLVENAYARQVMNSWE
jgi:hypothetical protein